MPLNRGNIEWREHPVPLKGFMMFMIQHATRASCLLYPEADTVCILLSPSCVADQLLHRPESCQKKIGVRNSASLKRGQRSASASDSSTFLGYIRSSSPLLVLQALFSTLSSNGRADLHPPVPGGHGQGKGSQGLGSPQFGSWTWKGDAWVDILSRVANRTPLIYVVGLWNPFYAVVWAGACKSSKLDLHKLLVSNLG